MTEIKMKSTYGNSRRVGEMERDSDFPSFSDFLKKRKNEPIKEEDTQHDTTLTLGSVISLPCYDKILDYYVKKTIYTSDVLKGQAWCDSDLE